MEKKKDNGPVLKRDEHNKLDQDDAQRVQDQLLRKLLTEQRLHEKDTSMHMSRTSKRDIIVHLSVTMMGKVDGHPLIGEADKEYNQWAFIIPANMQPITLATLRKAMQELTLFGAKAFIDMGRIKEG